MSRRVNQRELAEILDLSDVRVWELQREGLPIAEQGARGEANVYDTGAVVQWLIDRALARSGTDEARMKREILELDLKDKRRKDALEENALVPAEQVRPVWQGRVLAAAFYMQGRHSRLAAMLEAAQGIAARRTVLKQSDAEFLNHLGVHGERLQTAADELLAEIPEQRRERFFAELCEP